MKTKNLFSKPVIAQCRSKVLQNALREHSAILLTFIKVPFVFKTFVLSIIEWLLKTGFTVVTRADTAADSKPIMACSSETITPLTCTLNGLCMCACTCNKMFKT